MPKGGADDGDSWEREAERDSQAWDDRVYIKKKEKHEGRRQKKH